MTLKANEDALRRKVESEMYTIDAERKKINEAEKKLKRYQGNAGTKKPNDNSVNGTETDLDGLFNNSKRDTPKKKF